MSCKNIHLMIVHVTHFITSWQANFLLYVLILLMEMISILLLSSIFIEESIEIAKIFEIRFSMDLHVWDILNTIWPFLENFCLFVGLSVCLHVSKILWTLYLRSKCSEIHETLYSVVFWWKLELIRDWRISANGWLCYDTFPSKFSIVKISYNSESFAWILTKRRW